MSYHFRQGQALIIMIMVMAVSLTLGVAISSRVVTTLRQISYSAQSAEALALAEAGAEDGLKRIKDNSSQPCPGPASPPCSFSDVPLGNGTYSYTIDSLAASAVFDKLSPISRDKAVQIDLNGYPAGTSIYVHWVDKNNPTENNPCVSPTLDTDCPAMEVSIVYLEGGSYKLLRYAWDPRPTRGANDPNFFTPGSLGYTPLPGGITYRYRASLSAPAGTTPKLLRLRALYTAVPNSFAISAGAGTLPSQGVKIISTGYVGRIQRKVEAIRSQPALSELFDFVLFSGSQSVPLSK